MVNIVKDQYLNDIDEVGEIEELEEKLGNNAEELKDYPDEEDDLTDCPSCKSNCTIYQGSEDGVDWYKCLDCSISFTTKTQKFLTHQEQLTADYGKRE